MICKNCGAEIKDTLKFCNKCGAKVVADTPKAPIPEEPVAPASNTVQSAQTKSVTERNVKKVTEAARVESEPVKEAKELDRSNPKSKVVAGVLALLLGFFGIHWFYLKKPLRGIIYIAIYVLTVILFVPLAILFEIFVLGEAIFFFVAKPEKVEKYARQAIKR